MLKLPIFIAAWLSTSFLVSFLVSPAIADPPHAPLEGTYRAWVVGLGGEVPFGLEFTRNERGLAATIENGIERVAVARVLERSGGATLHFDPYESRIEFELDETGRELHGEWIRDRGGAAPTRLKFGASKGTHPRFASRLDPASGERSSTRSDIGGEWRVQFKSESEHAVGVFSADPRPGAGPTDVIGTFQTTLGDYRYLAGSFEGDLLRLSVFDGAHAFRFVATVGDDGALAGDFWSRDSWHDTWTATREDGVTLGDPFSISKVEEGVDWSELAYPDLEGRVRRLDDPAFRGRARLIVVFGTWCPNCNDETAYLVELDRRYRSRGLSILGLAFEFGEELDRSGDVVRR